MHLGVIFPQTEIGADPTAVRDFVQAAEGLGYAHLIVFDHVLGADVAQHPGWQGGYTHRGICFMNRSCSTAIWPPSRTVWNW